MKTESFPAPWQTLGTVPIADLVEGKVQLHWAAQIVSAFGNALLDPQPDDSQSNLGWVDSLGAFEMKRLTLLHFIHGKSESR